MKVNGIVCDKIKVEFDCGELTLTEMQLWAIKEASE